ncbi:hypothetical protein AVEN_262482-1 [Araneus ventricosus]|uniref:Uncharacterized protein n=1 Tax=Araneus ventricosus TaxID=182803 RepID=A0A4Y2NZ73_ARAVE|nr:hypothetical protein AVEN_262482-1 [Araneus ventricosus]
MPEKRGLLQVELFGGSRLWRRRAPGLKPDSTEDSSWWGRCGLVVRSKLDSAEDPLYIGPVTLVVVVFDDDDDQQSYIRSMSLCTLKKSKVNRGLETRSYLESPRHAII